MTCGGLLAAELFDDFVALRSEIPVVEHNEWQEADNFKQTCYVEAQVYLVFNRLRCSFTHCNVKEESHQVAQLE